MSRKIPAEEDGHTCHKPEGTCRFCPACEDKRVEVTSRSALMPKVLTCTHCDGPFAAGNISRGRGTAA